jgi:Fuc2NAc and GlcNAc transferase
MPSIFFLTIFSLATAAFACAVTAAMLRLAPACQMLDVPNARSSHTAPTPRGGGVAIVVSFLVALAILAALGQVEGRPALALWGSGLAVALIGFLDDRSHVPARWRFLVHLLSSAWGLWLLGSLHTVAVFDPHPGWGWFSAVLIVLCLTWVINLYNFMDGIDGIAGTEAVTVSLAGALTWWLAAPDSTWWLPIIFAACSAGFLIWNLPPARIFMGDAGSGFIGLMLGLLGIWASGAAPQLLWCWAILLGCFVVDASVTLIRRVLRGEKFYEAHRSHAYQYAARKFRSHGRVTLAFGMVNVVWLLPIAMLVANGTLAGWLGLALAYGPLILMALRFKAGDRQAQDV